MSPDQHPRNTSVTVLRAGVMRILDLGCGSGRDLRLWGAVDSDQIIGVDIDTVRLMAAKAEYPERHYVRARGERLPFANGSFDRVISRFAMPYLNVQHALAEIHRILVPGGKVTLSLHLPRFTFRELMRNAIPKPIPTVFRFYVLANGLLFHWTGRTAGFINGRTESFQTKRGMRLALTRAGFVDLSFGPADGPRETTFLVEAAKSQSTIRGVLVA